MWKRVFIHTSLLYLSFFGLSSSQTCTTAQFPKTLGGSFANTVMRSIAFHELTDSLAAVGYVEDIGIRGTNTYVGAYTGLIALYKGPFLTLAWGKTQLDFKHFYPVQFSTDGVLLVTTTCCSGNQYLLIFQASDGALLRAATYPDSVGTYDLSTRNMVMVGVDANGCYNVWLNVKQSTFPVSSAYTGYYLFSAKFTIASLATTNPTVMWSRRSQVTGSTEFPMGLIIDPQDQYLFSLGI
jgi:hypothetical protein